MPVYLTLTALTIALSALTKSSARGESRQAALNRVAIAAVFTALFLVAALRVRVGNDYWWYTDIMHEISVHGVVPTEFGFNLVVFAVYKLFGFENYLFVFALFSFLTVALFLAGIARQSEDFFFSFTMFILLCYYFQSLSTVRYYVALAAAFYALRDCEKGDYPRFGLIVALAATVHKSALAPLLLYPLAKLRWRKSVVAVGALLCVSFLAFPTFWTSVALRLYPTYQNVENLGGGEWNAPNILRCLLVLALVGVVYYRDRTLFADRRIALYTKLSVMALALYVSCAFLPQISRVGFYLTTPQILLVPALCKRIADARLRRASQVATVAVCLLYFARYMMRAGDDGILILPYRTFLFYEG